MNHRGAGWSAVARAIRSEKVNDARATSSSKLPRRMPLGAVARSATGTISVPAFQRISCARVALSRSALGRPFSGR